MRDFRIQAMINLGRTVYRGELGVIPILRYISFWFLSKEKYKLKANKFFDPNDFYKFKKTLFTFGHKDPAWFPRLMEPTTLGLRGWEYGHLFWKTKFFGKKVLDVGPGSSRLPKYLAKLGAKVVMLDMDKPLEETMVKKSKNLKFVLGDMTKMNFENNKFDVVICISAIEHVDMSKSGYYTRKIYKKRALLAIKEMVRVLKCGGLFYLTTDFYTKKQKSDNWPYTKGKIRGAFEMRFLETMLSTMQDCGIVFDSKPESNPSILIKDGNRANYRGRYFTTYVFRGKKS